MFNREKKLLKLNKKLEKVNLKLNSVDESTYQYEKLYTEKVYLLKMIELYQSDKSDKDITVEKALSKEKKKRYLILYGKMVPVIVSICLPLAIYALFNTFYGLIDSIMATNVSQNAVSKISIISQVKNTLSAFGAGVASGGAVLVARFYGAGKMDKARNAASNMLLIEGVLMALTLVLLIPLSKPILIIAQTPDITFDIIIYFILVLVEICILSFNNMFIALEKVKGNSKKIFFLNIMVLIVKLSLNVFFIYGIKVDTIIYLEVSTIIGQLVLLIVGSIILFGKKNMLRIEFKHIRPKKEYIVPIIKLSIPIFLGKFVMNLGKTIVNSLCGLFYGAETDGLIVGALAISNNLSGLVTSPTGVFEEGESSMISQNIGNKNLKRTIKLFKRAFIICMTITIVGFILVRFVFMDDLTNLFIVKKDLSGLTESERLIQEANQRVLAKYIEEIFIYDSLSIPALGLASTVLGLLYGYGKTFLSSILNFSRILVRIISLTVCHSIGLGHEAAGISMGISNILIGVMSATFLIIFLVKLKKNGFQGMKISDPEPQKEEFVL